MKKIAIDLDMTLVDLIPYMRSLFHSFGLYFIYPSSWNFDNYPIDVKNEILHDFMSPDCKVVTTQFPVYPGVLRTLNLLKRNGWYLEIVSARTNSEINKKYIEINFPMVDKITLLESNGSDNKFEYINDNNFDIWVDDYPKNYEKITNCRVILISNNETLYNHFMRSDLKYITSFNEILEVI